MSHGNAPICAAPLPIELPDARVGLQRSRDSSVGKASDRIPVKGDAEFSSASESL
jgi:hypothetical protein